MQIFTGVREIRGVKQKSGRLRCRFSYLSVRRVDSGSRQTLLVLQFVIDFADIWAQYSPSTYASTHVGFFDLCPNVKMAAL